MPGKYHGQKSLVGYDPWGCKELDTTEWLHFHFSLSCIREGDGNPLQCSCLENPRDGEAWWAAICGVAQSQTQLKRLSSSSPISSIPTSIKVNSVQLPELACQARHVRKRDHHRNRGHHTRREGSLEQANPWSLKSDCLAIAP